MISLVLLSVLVASIGSIDTVAAKQLRKENDIQSITGIDGQGLEPHRVEVVPNSTVTDAVPNEEAGSITATLSSSAVKKPITATLASSSFKKQPPRRDSALTDEEWEIVKKGTDALNGIEWMMADLPDGNDPAQIMNFLGEVSNTIGIFVPQFALVGAAFGILGTILGKTPELAEDPMMKFFEDRFDKIDSKLDTFEVKRIQMEFCKNTWDDDIDTYIVNYRTHLDRLKNPQSTVKEKQVAFSRLEKKCLDIPPNELLGRWKKDFLGEGFSQCFLKIKEDSDSRVLYFRKTYTALFLRYMMEAVELDGLCLGILQQSPTNSNVSTEQDETTAIFTAMYREFKVAEDKMFKSTPSEWRNTLITRHRDCKGNADCTYKALKDNFFPGYAYAAFKKDTPNYTSFGGPVKQDYGLFRNDDVYVVFRSPNNRDSFTRLEIEWKNNICRGTAMCLREVEDCGFFTCSTSCEFTNCDSTWHMAHENTKLNNKATYDIYANRNAIMIRTELQRKECTLWTHGGCAFEEKEWSSDELLNPIGNIVGDLDIIDKFTTSWETDPNEILPSKRSKYTIIGVGGSGNF